MAVTQGTMNKAFVSAIDFLDQRDIDPNIYDQSRDRAFTDIMKIVNRYKPATMFNYHNFVNNDVREIGTISAVSNTGMAQVTFTINTAATYPRLGDIIKSSNVNCAGKQALVISAPTFGSGTATLTVRSVAGNASPWYATVGDTISFASDAYAEKSDAPPNRRYALTKYFNLIQIFREVDEITDVQKVAKIEVQVNGDYHILPYQFIQKKIKLEGDISVAMLCGEQSITQFGDQNPFLADATSGLPIQTTGGLDWYAVNYGINDQAPVLGIFSLTTIDQMIDNWIANKAPTDQMGFMGSRAYRLISTYLKNLGSSGVTSVRMNIDGRTMDFEVEHLSYGGYELDFVHVPIFDNPQLFSATLSPEINGSIYWVPKGNVDTVDNGQQPYLQIRHTPSPFGGGVNGSNNGIMAEWRTGALAETPTSSLAQLHTDWYTAQGLEGLAPKHFQKFRVI
ncbi:MAG: hypothetical protein KGI27_13305 [Thaumarchaeota archaeon]|nr:hypothetical protein [Nitrososphaerota archaeon]